MSDPKPPRGGSAAAAAAKDSKEKESLFPVGIVGQRELKTALQKSRNPAETIKDFQTSHSLNAMLAKAFRTIPTAKYKSTRSSVAVDGGRMKEPLDTDPVMTFLSHLGVRQQSVHEKISNKLLKLLEETIQKTDDETAVLSLLSSCWFYVTSITELEPVLLAVLKRLGKNTPPAMLQTLVERNTTNTTDNGSKRNELKYGRIFDKLQFTLKRLCWESDWERRVVGLDSSTTDPVEVLSQMEGTLFYETVQPLIRNYISNDKLRLLANLPFVETISERKIITVQRRALSKAGQQNTIFHHTGESIQQIGTLIGYASGSLSSAAMLKTSQNGGAGGANASQRPQLLYAVIAILMTTHGLPSTPEFLAGGDHLHCTLLSDLLLSLGGPLPKAYTDVLALARVLDECVQEGHLSDPNVIKIQTVLRLIFPADSSSDSNNTDTNNGEKTSAAAAAVVVTNPKKKSASTASSKTITATTIALSNAELRQLNQIITSGLTALKDADSQNLFLNPVTDAIAPGYSRIIKIPMCVSTMEDKVARNQYDSVQKWTLDVELMFKNCITYNRGPAGQWFRDEAHRQAKHFREVIVPPRLALAQNKLSSTSPSAISVVSSPIRNQIVAGSSNVVNTFNKRERDETATDQPSSSSPQITPLEPVTKKRKKGTTKDEKQLPSMPAMASMLLCDPFVVRIIIDRILREVRQAVLKGNLLPTSHQVIPSLLQLLHLARWSKQICAVRGRKYFVPSAGLEEISNLQEMEEKKMDPATLASYTCLRRSLPTIAGLLLEAEFDFRCTSIGGDLQQAAQAAESPPTFKFHFDSSSSSSIKQQPAHVAAALLVGAFVTVCQPISSRDDRFIALEVTFPKFGATLLHAKSSFLNDRLFFGCLIRALVRHRTKLSKAARDSIVTTWQRWLGESHHNNSDDDDDDDDIQKSSGSKEAALTSTAHEHLIKLFNQWSSMGNVLLPRDDLIRFTKATVEILGTSKFVSAFGKNDESQTGLSPSFKKIRDQYIYMLKHLPVAIAKQWLSDLELDHSILGAKESQSEAAAATTKDDATALAAK